MPTFPMKLFKTKKSTKTSPNLTEDPKTTKTEQKQQGPKIAMYGSGFGGMRYIKYTN